MADIDVKFMRMSREARNEMLKQDKPKKKTVKKSSAKKSNKKK